MKVVADHVNVVRTVGPMSKFVGLRMVSNVHPTSSSMFKSGHGTFIYCAVIVTDSYIRLKFKNKYKHMK
jgi:hypothetical protein